MKICKINDCNEKHHSRGYCDNHYRRLLRHGDPFAGQKIHGKSGTAEYFSWCGAKARCNSKTNKDYKNYGGRGIKFCKEWENDFPQFLKDMGLKPSSKHSLDRIDVNGNYESKNCRWATAKEQCRNLRRNHVLEYNGRSKTIAEWAEETGINYTTIKERLKMGWPIERTLTEKVKPQRKMRKGLLLTFQGESLTVTEWAKKIGMSNVGLHDRLNAGWSIEKALSTPVAIKNKKPISL